MSGFFKNCGSIYVAIKSGFLEKDSVLKYLLDFPDYDLSKGIAYRAICAVYGSDQIINGNPFILQTECVEYINIYVNSFMGKNEKLARDDTETLQIMEKIWKFGSIGNQSFFICNTKQDHATLKSIDDIHYIYGCQSDNYINLTDKPTRIKFSLDYDYLTPLIDLNYNTYSNKLLARCRHLKSLFPDYWKQIGLSLYQQHILTSTNNGYKIESWESLKEYEELFPDLFKETIESGPLIYNLKNKTVYQQSYLLGLPLHYFQPSENQIKERIDKLKSLGIEEYCREVKISTTRIIESFSLNNTAKIVNTENLHGDDPLDYSPLDIIVYYDGEHGYHFTRPEFDYLVTKKKNPFNNVDISIPLLYEIHARLEIARGLELDDSKPLQILLQDLAIPKVPQPSEEQPIMDNEALFRIMFNYLVEMDMGEEEHLMEEEEDDEEEYDESD